MVCFGAEWSLGMCGHDVQTRTQFYEMFLIFAAQSNLDFLLSKRVAISFIYPDFYDFLLKTVGPCFPDATAHP
jgi:hypothetical protein